MKPPRRWYVIAFANHMFYREPVRLLCAHAREAARRGRERADVRSITVEATGELVPPELTGLDVDTRERVWGVR